MRRGGVWSRRAKGAAAVLLAVAGCGAVAAGIGGGLRLATARGFRIGGDGAGTGGRAALASSVHFAPRPGATAVAPDAPVVVRAGSGHLTSVRVTSTTGAAVDGELAPTGDVWRSSSPLAYGTEYRVTAKVAGADARAESSMSFSTLVPPAGISASVFPSSGLLVGVGQPVVVRFGAPVADPAARARVLDHLTVTESQPVVGGWYWFSDQELHFRPHDFWPTGEHVTVAWDLTGWDAGGGAWGVGAGGTSFDVGDAHVSYADLSTHLMTVTDNGRRVAVYPISGGKPADPTMSGVHVVLDRASVVRMVSSTNGIPVNSPDGYDELVYDDVHISDSGEYVHAAPWSVSSQGRSNVSHGCINLSPDNARAFFDFSRVGDVVIVVGSPRPPELGDHGVMDWDTDWAGFTPGALALAAPAGLATLH